MTISRREFLAGCSAAIAAMAGGRLGNLVFANNASAQNPAAANDETFVMIFLRGGCDGLSLLAPFGDGVYQQKRSNLALLAPGTIVDPASPDKVKEALEIDPRNISGNYTGGFGLHSQASPLKDLYTQGSLALVHACGLNDDTRSHFDAMDYIERGTPGNKNTGSGWISRHLQSAAPDGLLPVVSAGSASPASLLTNNAAVAMQSVDSYNVSAPWRFTNKNGPLQDALLVSLDQMYAGGNSLLQSTGRRTIETIRTLRERTAPGNGTGYPSNGFGDSLKLLAQIIKMDVGLRVATVDLGGWDHHESQGVSESYGQYFNLVKTLSTGLYAFYDEMYQAGRQGKLTIAVMSEFGRRLGRNSSDGTDHGHGGIMMLLGGGVQGGKVYGEWPGLTDLDQGQDLKIKTDYRNVLGEIVVNRLGNPSIGSVFPGLTQEQFEVGGKAGLGIFTPRADAPPITQLDYSNNLNQVHLPLVRKP